MDIELPLSILPQPDDSTCGPTCLHAIYDYYKYTCDLETLIADIKKLDNGGTLAVFLACDALRRGYRATIYTYNLQMFDPTWFTVKNTDIQDRLINQAREKKDEKLQHATDGYLEFLALGGKLRFTDLTTRLLRSILRRRLPILTGLSSTYLYQEKRGFGTNDEPDDIRGFPCGHFVVLSGYHRRNRTILVADPYKKNPLATGQFYPVNIDRVICAILLGVLTYDANLLVIHPRKASA